MIDFRILFIKKIQFWYLSPIANLARIMALPEKDMNYIFRQHAL